MSSEIVYYENLLIKNTSFECNKNFNKYEGDNN